MNTQNGDSLETPPGMIRAPSGFLFVKGRGTMLVRQRTRAERMAEIIKEECAGKGWHTKKISASEVQTMKPGAPVFLLNIGPMRGVRADEVYQILKSLPRKCGQRRILNSISRLQEHVVTF